MIHLSRLGKVTLCGKTVAWKGLKSYAVGDPTGKTTDEESLVDCPRCIKKIIERNLRLTELAAKNKVSP